MRNRSMTSLMTIAVILLLGFTRVSYSQVPFEPYLVKDLVETAGSSARIEEVTPVGDIVFFKAFTLDTGIELWKSDGTQEGTVLVKDIRSGPETSKLEWLTDINGTLFFAADDGEHGRELWKSDGTEAGTVIVRDRVPGAGYGNPAHLVNLDGVVLYQDSTNGLQYELYRSDGTVQGTYQVKDINPGLCPIVYYCLSRPRWLTNINGTVYFIAHHEDYGYELWKSDGTPDGTVLVKDINPGGCTHSYPNRYICNDGFNAAGRFHEFKGVGDIVYFVADDGIHGWELWRSDGTGEGTYMLKEIDPEGPVYYENPHANIRNLVEYNGDLYFSAREGYSYKLWKSDGTSEGTVPILDERFSSVSGAQIVNGELWISAREIAYPYTIAIYRSDGTNEGTVLVTSEVSSGREIISYEGKIVFRSSGGIWTSDGTPEGTSSFMPELDVTHPYGPSSYGGDKAFWIVGDRFLFVGSEGLYGFELWSSDLTTEGTEMVKDINPTVGSHAHIEEMVDANGAVFFIAKTPDLDLCLALYKSDGTEDGTVALTDGSCDNPNVGYHLTALNGMVYSHAIISGIGEVIFESDGTVEGTGSSIILDNNEVILGKITTANGLLYFETIRDDYEQSTGYYKKYHSVWKSNGTTEGTIKLTSFIHESYDESGFETSGCSNSSPRLEWRRESFVESNGHVFFNFCDSQYGWELWVTDGTPEGTTMVKDINPGDRGLPLHTPYHGNPRDLVDVNGSLYFRAYTENEGAELWTSDGTEAGTILVKDLYPGTVYGVPQSSFPDWLTNVDGMLYFTAYDGSSVPLNYRMMVWVSDGTPDGTVNLDAPIQLSKNVGDYWPRFITSYQGSAFFAAIEEDDELVGGALWKVDSNGYDTEIVTEIAPHGDNGMLSYLTTVDNTLFFTGSTQETGNEIWMSDGTEAGTLLVEDLYPGPFSGSGTQLSVASEGTLFFAGQDPLLGWNIWAIRTWFEVEIDIKPESEMNCVNLNEHGVIPVVLFGNEDIDAQQIDVSSLSLQGLKVKMAGKSNQYSAHYEDVNLDSYVDIVLQFEDSDNWLLSSSDLAKLSGETIDGRTFKGTDEICFVR